MLQTILTIAGIALVLTICWPFIQFVFAVACLLAPLAFVLLPLLLIFLCAGGGGEKSLGGHDCRR